MSCVPCFLASNSAAEVLLHRVGRSREVSTGRTFCVTTIRAFLTPRTGIDFAGALATLPVPCHIYWLGPSAWKWPWHFETSRSSAHIQMKGRDDFTYLYLLIGDLRGMVCCCRGVDEASSEDRKLVEVCKGSRSEKGKTCAACAVALACHLLGASSRSSLGSYTIQRVTGRSLSVVLFALLRREQCSVDI